jgi:hypothetical protein
MRKVDESLDMPKPKTAAQLDAEIAEALRAKTVALQASETTKRRSDDVFDAAAHRAKAEAHRRAAKLHKSDPAGADAAGTRRRKKARLIA